VSSKPTYPLHEIKADFANPNKMLVSRTVKNDYTRLGLSDSDVVNIIQNLTGSHFYKTMKSTFDQRTNHDVYKCDWKNLHLYIKFVRNYGQTQLLLVSFKEDESYV